MGEGVVLVETDDRPKQPPPPFVSVLASGNLCKKNLHALLKYQQKSQVGVTFCVHRIR